MGARRFLMIIGVIVALAAVIALIFLVIRFYGTGFDGYTIITTTQTIKGISPPTTTRTVANQPGKMLWDWMQLLFIPVVLAVAGFWFSHRERKAAESRADNEREIEQQRAKAEQETASDNQREVALQTYIDKISELLLHENLRESLFPSEVRDIAQLRTVTVLSVLDSKRKGIVLQFLRDAGLIYKGNPIVDLSSVDLRETELPRAYLDGVELVAVDLSGANLKWANLLQANLVDANLTKANLTDATMVEANLEGACLKEARLSGADLRGTNLRGADRYAGYRAGPDRGEEHLWSNRNQSDRPDRALGQIALSRGRRADPAWVVGRQ